MEEGGTGEEQHAIAKMQKYCQWMYSKILPMDVLKNTVNGCIKKYCQWMYAEILSMDVCKNTVNGCIQVLETTSETDPLLIAHRVDDIADVDD